MGLPKENDGPPPFDPGIARQGTRRRSEGSFLNGVKMRSKEIRESQGVEVWVNTRSHGQSKFESEGAFAFARVPVIGEHFKLQQHQESPWYVVTMVFHLPFDEADGWAEIYAVEVDDKAAVLAAKSTP
jgi:hypothetical protein